MKTAVETIAGSYRHESVPSNEQSRVMSATSVKKSNWSMWSPFHSREILRFALT